MTNVELIEALVNQTDHDIKEFTGAAIIQTMINNKSVVKHKVSLYFGYENKKPLTRIIEIDKEVFFKLPQALDDYLTSVVNATDNGVFTMGKPTGRSTTNPTTNPTPTNTITINTNTNMKTTPTKKSLFDFDSYGNDKDLAKELVEYRKQLGKPLKTDKGLKGILDGIKETSKEKKIPIRTVVDYMMGKEWMTAQVSYFNDYSSQQQSQRKVLSR
jgi:hypothetical protein